MSGYLSPPAIRLGSMTPEPETRYQTGEFSKVFKRGIIYDDSKVREGLLISVVLTDTLLNLKHKRTLSTL